jgi:DNA-binding transcriptional ArsR family regulator
MKPIPTPWNIYNLKASPFFQSYLSSNVLAAAPLSLFVGRSREVGELRGRIHGSGGHGTRQAVAGAPGVGKTTLVQEIKSLLQEDGYFTADTFVAVVPDDSPETLFGKLLSTVYDTIIANRPGTADNPAMQDAQLLVRATRLGTRSMGATVAGFGAHSGSSVVPLTPKDMLIDGPRLLRDLLALVARSDGLGVIVHLNNLENLTEREAKGAAEVFRALRDPMMMHDRLHLLVVGTTDAISGVVDTHAQVRSVVSTLKLGPLSRDEVLTLLAARYDHLRMDKDHPAISPVTDEVVTNLHELYGGDLRSFLRALEDGVTPLLGAHGSKSMDWDVIAPALQAHYETLMGEFHDQQRAGYLMIWGESGKTGPQTQEDLEALWGVSRGTVSQALSVLVQHGYVVAHPRNKRDPILYSLSGTSSLIFGMRP